MQLPHRITSYNVCYTKLLRKLTTEYPDENLRGEAFALACAAQTEAALAAYDAYQKIVG